MANTKSRRSTAKLQQNQDCKATDHPCEVASPAAASRDFAAEAEAQESKFEATLIQDEDWSALNTILLESNQYAQGTGERQLCLENLYTNLRRIYAMKPERDGANADVAVIEDPKSAASSDDDDKEPPAQGKGKGKGKVKVGGNKKRPLIDVDVVEPKDKSLSSASTPLASSPPESSSMPAPIAKRPRRASARIRSAA